VAVLLERFEYRACSDVDVLFFLLDALNVAVKKVDKRGRNTTSDAREQM